MATSKERLVDALKQSELGSSATSSAAPVTETGMTFLQLFLNRVKFFAIAKREHPEFKLDTAKMQRLDASLNSPDKHIQEQAFQEIDIIHTISQQAKDKIETTTLESIVDTSSLSARAKPDLKKLARRLEAELASTSTLKTEAELDKLYNDLNVLREGLGQENMGVKENAIGLEYLDNKQNQLYARKEITEFKTAAGEFRSSPIDKYSDKFNPTPKSDDLIQVRVAWNKGLKNRVDKFRTNVREELLSPDKERKLRDLSGEEALDRIKAVGELKAHIHELHGDKWVKNKSAEKMDEIRLALDTVQAEYQGELAKKIAEKLKKQGNTGDVLRHIAPALDRVIEKHRHPGRSTYKFEGSDSFDNLSQQVLIEAQQMKKDIPKARAAVPRHDSEDMPSMSEEEEYAEGEWKYKRQKELQKKVDEFRVAMAGTNYKFDDPQFLKDIREDDGIDKIILEMRARGLDPSKEGLVREGLEGFRAGTERTEGGMSMKAELEELLANKKHAEAINLTMEYLARVGLKEASSDWQLAITLRMQKDIISRINSDAAEAFEARQHLLFLPNPNGLSHEKFGEVMAQVLTKGNLDYALSPSNVFMLGTEVEINGKRLNINTAMFKDLLRSEAASMRLLNADVNSTDSTLRGILAEHIWGKGTQLIDLGHRIKLANGEIIDLHETKTTMRFFDIDASNKNPHYGKLMEEGKDVSLYEMFERTNWMMRDAQQFWWYGREWEKHLVNYPKNKMRNAPKKIASMGRMFSAYNGEFEKYDRAMVQISLLGTMLQPGEVYKIHTTVGANVKDILIEKYKADGLWGKSANGVTYDANRAKKIGDLMVKLVSDRVIIDDQEFTVDTLSQEAVRLVGNSINTSNLDNFYGLIKQRYLEMGMDEVNIPTLETMRGHYNTWKNADINTRMKIDDEGVRFWGAQVEEMVAWIDMRKFDPKDLGLINSISAAELQPFLDREAAVFGRKRTANSLSEFFQGNGSTEGFQFTSIMDPKKLDQGDDTFQYGSNYYPRSLQAADKQAKYLNLELNAEERAEMFGIMQGYVPADVLRKYMTVAERHYLKAQSIQSTPFEIAHEGGKWQTLENGQKEWVKAESPNAIDYITLTDKDGNKWQAKGRNGERVYVKEMTKRFHSHAYDTKGKWILRESDVETDLSVLNAKGYITKDKKDDMMASITGVGQGVDKFLKRLGIDTSKGNGRFARKVITKFLAVIKKHPLFDDPVWAFWSISNTMWEYVKEVGKEMAKEVAK